jgi:hypothetical protein
MNQRYNRTTLLRKLFDQELWCLGQDIRHPAENLLLACGMCLARYTQERPGEAGSAYGATLHNGERIVLWGFGAAVGDDNHAMFLRRFQASPAWLPGPLIAQGGRLRDLPVRPAQTQTERRLIQSRLKALLIWFASYEHWVQERHGLAYRTQTLAARDSPAICPPGQMAKIWENLAKQADRLETKSWRTVLWTKALKTSI